MGGNDKLSRSTAEMRPPISYRITSDARGGEGMELLAGFVLSVAASLLAAWIYDEIKKAR